MKSSFILPSLISISSAFAGDDDLLKMVSEKTDLAIHLTNIQTTQKNWEKSPLKKIYDSEEIKPRVEEALEEFLAFEDDEEVGAFFKELVPLYEFLEGEILLSLKIPALDKEAIKEIFFEDDSTDHKAIKLAYETFGVLALAEINDAEAFAKTADKAIKNLAELTEKQSDDDVEVVVKKEALDGIEVTSFSVEEEDIMINLFSHGVVGKTAFLAFGACEQKDLIAEMKNGHAKPLSKAEFIADHPTDFQLLSNLEDAWASLRNLLEYYLENEGMVAQYQLNMDAGWKALAMDQMRRFSLAFDISQPDIVMTSKMDLPAKGIFSYLIGNEPLKEFSQLAHPGVYVLTQTSYDIAGVYDEVMKTIKAFSPMGPMLVGTQISEFEKQLGIKIREDLLEFIAPRWQSLQFKNSTHLEEHQRLGIMMGLKDEAKFESTLKTMMGALEIEISKEEFLDQTIHQIPLPFFGEDEQLCYAIMGKEVLLGFKAGDTVKEMIKQIKNPRETIWKSDLFEDHQDLFKPGAVYIDMSDVGDELASIFEFLGEDDEDSIDYSKIKIPYGYYLGTTWLKKGVAETKAVFLAK